MSVWWMETSANLKSQVTKTGKVTLLDSLVLLKNSRGILFEMFEI